MSLKTTRGDMTRAVMEGVTYSMRQVADIIGDFCPCKKIILSGGGANSPLWRQMYADIFDLPVYTLSAAGEGGAYGAVMVAGVGAGIWKNLGEAISLLQVETETLPNPETQAVYRNAYAAYGEIYPALKPLFDKTAAMGW